MNNPKSYSECVDDIREAHPSLTSNDLAKLLFTRKDAMLRRLRGKHQTNTEGLVVANLVRDVVCATKQERASLRKGAESGSILGMVLDACEEL